MSDGTVIVMPGCQDSAYVEPGNRDRTGRMITTYRPGPDIVLVEEEHPLARRLAIGWIGILAAALLVAVTQTIAAEPTHPPKSTVTQVGAVCNNC